MEAIHLSQLGEIERRFGGRVEIDAFIELVEDDLSDLPDPVLAHPGDLPIATAQTRMGGGMAALGRFTLRFDRQLRCTYLDVYGSRAIAVWPFGYSADAGPVRVYDFDGSLVLRHGDTFEMGGGSPPGLDWLPTGTETCGADSAFLSSGPPELVDAP